MRRLIVFALMIAAACFCAGAVFQKFKPFPYSQLKSVAGSIKRLIAKSPDTGAVELSPDPVLENRDPNLAKNIDTGLLPLSVAGVRVGALQPVAKVAGGIAIVSGAVIIADHVGQLFASWNGSLRPIPAPPIPNGAKEFMADRKLPLAVLRVHDVEYLRDDALLAVSFEAYSPAEKAPRLTVAVIKFDERSTAVSGEWRVIFEGTPMRQDHFASLAGGGRLAYKAPGKVWLTCGDYNQDGVMLASPQMAQDMSVTFGKIFEIDVLKGARQQVSMGHRNPQGLAFTSAGVYATEHGPAGGDELNCIRQGANYGWPQETLGTDYGAYDMPGALPVGRHARFEAPIFAWVPSIGVGNLVEVRGFNERWDGDLLVASLKAESLVRVRLEKGRAMVAEQIFIGSRIRDLACLPDGRIVLWTDDAELLYLSVDRQALANNRRGLNVAGQPWMAVCVMCHHFGNTAPTSLAPSLGGVVGRKIGSDTFSRYSPAFKAAEGVWTIERLKAFIADPSAVIPGTSMPKPQISPDDLERIVQTLSYDKAPAASGGTKEAH